MSKNADWVYNWGAGAEGTDSGVFVAPASTSITEITGPTDDWPTGFSEVGWLSDAGITEGHSVDNTDKRAWQAGALIKRIKNNEQRTFAFEALEENAVVLGLARPGSTTTVATGVAKTPVKSGTGSDVRWFGIDFLVGSVHKRYVGKGEVTSFSDIVYKSDDLTVYGFTVSMYPDSNGVYFTEYSDAPGVTES